MPIHGQDDAAETRVQHQHVPRLDVHVVRLHDALQILVTHDMTLVAEMRVQVDQHAAALDRLDGEVLDTERRCARLASAVCRVRVLRPFDVLVPPVTVVVHNLGPPIPVRVDWPVGRNVPRVEYCSASVTWSSQITSVLRTSNRPRKGS